MTRLCDGTESSDERDLRNLFERFLSSREVLDSDLLDAGCVTPAVNSKSLIDIGAFEPTGSAACSVTV